MERFLAVNKKELAERGVETPDFVIVSADAYVDHPSFANALLGRWLEALGYSVGMICQPNYGDARAYQIFGRPRLAFLVSGGNMDSMVNMYTASKARRKSDMYSPGGKNARPRRATIVYTQMIKKVYPDAAVIIGGVEASLRRFAHYDYWDNAVRASILADAPADLLVYGMGERPLMEIAEGLSSGMPISELTYIRGTAYMADAEREIYEDHVVIPSYEEVAADKRRYAETFAAEYAQQDHIAGKTVVQPHGERLLVQNPPQEPLSRQEMDDIYALPFNRKAHPSYKEPIPALEEVQFSLVSTRGCYGGCSFCSIYFHQGRYIQSRSRESLVEEAKKLIAMEGFKGYIHDVGGPTANFTGPPCTKAEKHGMCTGRRCLAPTPCKNLTADHSEYLENLRALRGLPGVKKVFIRSGVRFDYALLDRKTDFIAELARYHTSGELKVAPEHSSPEVLRLMGKPDIDVFCRFAKRFADASAKAGKKQYVLPYFIASHPGATLSRAIELAEFLNKWGFVPDQVQDFYPTPGSISTCMYYTGLDPLTMNSVYVPKSREERAMQRALLQFNKQENYPLVKKALLMAGRTDLIGRGPNALIRG